MKIKSKCPVYGRWPSLKTWLLLMGSFMVYEICLICENGSHVCCTSYSEDIEKVGLDWERLVKEKECKMKKTGGLK
jgi:hypothetical protein